MASSPSQEAAVDPFSALYVSSGDQHTRSHPKHEYDRQISSQTRQIVQYRPDCPARRKAMRKSSPREEVADALVAADALAPKKRLEVLATWRFPFEDTKQLLQVA